MIPKQQHFVASSVREEHAGGLNRPQGRLVLAVRARWAVNWQLVWYGRAHQIDLNDEGDLIRPHIGPRSLPGVKSLAIVCMRYLTDRLETLRIGHVSCGN
jgi:hypothetical protein